MSIQKFRTLEDAEQAQWNFHPDKLYYQHIKELFRLGLKLSQSQFPHGVFKYKTLDSANKQKQQWILEQAIQISKTGKI